MFYCEPCREKNKWPGFNLVSRGQCEVCGQPASCYEATASYLPVSRPEEKTSLPTLVSLNDAIEQARARRDAVLKERKEQAERAKVEKARLLLDDVYNAVCNKLVPAMMAAADKGESTFHLTFGD